MQDQALKNIQRKVSRRLGPLSQIWDELDKESSTMNIEQVAELIIIEKTVVLLGQVKHHMLIRKASELASKNLQECRNGKTSD